MFTGASIGRVLILIMAVLGICFSAVLSGCRTTWDTPVGPVTVEPAQRGPGTNIPAPGTPGTQLPNPADPGRPVTGYDTDGDGFIDLIWDPVTKRWYRITPIRIPAGGKIVRRGTTLTHVGAQQPPAPLTGPMVMGQVAEPLGCLIGQSPLPWGNVTAEQWLQNKGLTGSAGVRVTSELLFKHEFDTEGQADVTLFWSTNFGVTRPWDYNLCYDMHGLSSDQPGSPAGMQIRVRGAWLDVARWLVSMGVDRIDHTEAGVRWTVEATPDNQAILVFADGTLIRVYPLN